VESRWRQNIADEGMVHSGILLLSRLLDTPNPDAWLARMVGLPHTGFIYLRGPDQVLYNALAYFDLPGHFPWTFEVVPDV